MKYSNNMPYKFILCFTITFITIVSASTSSAYNGSPQLRGRSLNSGGCCSIDYMQCDASFCGLTEESCNTCEQDVDAAWLPNGPRSQGSCLKKWADCTHNPDSCCSPGTCVEVNSFYSQCQYVEPSMAPSEVPSMAPSDVPSSTPSAVPTMTPSASPSETPSESSSTLPSFEPSAHPSATPSISLSNKGTDHPDGCCSLNFKNCDASWCGRSKDHCESCKQDVQVTWLPTGKRSWCLAKWSDCTRNRSGCCNPARCVKVNSHYYQCQP
uniref:CBM1 domain-containing protein n=1 Tax=Leptocylindrus aporus TaxID=1398097 RepID=A0A7S0PIL8_9STRA|mmetsp:Transcript_1300/g.1746  ORF Transcript_1300/g.1746 Transcript_1300/m.1746 type:complete len:268 (+) Transcript_1300:47-850(+)